MSLGNLDKVLSRLEKVKSRGGGQYNALCPCHDEKTPSLGVKEVEPDKLIIHCFGCGAGGLDVVAALGLDIADLFPPDDGTYSKKSNKVGFPTGQILNALQFEVTIVEVIASKMLRGEDLSSEEMLRLSFAAERIREGATYARKA